MYYHFLIVIKAIIFDGSLGSSYNVNKLSADNAHRRHSCQYSLLEMVGYDGPIYMTHPTKAIAPILLEDFRKITVGRQGNENFFTSEMIKICMKKSIAVNLHQRVQVNHRCYLILILYLSGRDRKSVV